VSDDWRVRIDDPSPELESRLVEELGNAEIGRGDVEMLLWFDTADEAWSAAETVARLIDAERLASSVGVEWWDHESQEWQSTAEDDSAGDEGWETEGGFDFDDRTEVVDAPDEVWEVVVKLESRGSARELAAQAAAPRPRPEAALAARRLRVRGAGDRREAGIRSPHGSRARNGDSRAPRSWTGVVPRGNGRRRRRRPRASWRPPRARRRARKRRRRRRGRGHRRRRRRR
jgi:hypothetical protein